MTMNLQLPVLPQCMGHLLIRTVVNIAVIIVIIVLFKFSEVSTHCNHGDVRLVNGSAPNEGRVEVCVNSIWGTVCDAMGWGNEDAEVICRQLGYTPEGAIARYRGYYGQGEGSIWLDNVRCNRTWDMSLLECPHRPIPLFMALSYNNCNHSKDAGVQCRDDQGQVKTVKAKIINPVHTVLISWELENSTRAGVPIMFKIECYSEKHSIITSESNQSSTVSLGGLLSSTYYNCCVSAVYELYTARKICTEVETISTVTTSRSTTIIKEASNSTNATGGILGFIIAVLLVLLILSGILLICQLRPQWKERLSSILPRLPKSRIVNQSNTMDVPVRNNLSYVTTLSPHSTTKTSGTAPSEAIKVTADAYIVSQDEAHCDGPDYSSLGPQYENIDSMRESQRKNEAHARLLSEQYEHSEAHVHGVVATDGGTTEASAQYEVPLNLKQKKCTENEDYSHLKY